MTIPAHCPAACKPIVTILRRQPLPVPCGDGWPQPHGLHASGQCLGLPSGLAGGAQRRRDAGPAHGGHRPQRSRPEYARALVEDLRWLGLDWDEGPAVDGIIPDEGDMAEQGPCGPYFQSARAALYDATLDAMDRAGLVYPCYCTRKDCASWPEPPCG